LVATGANADELFNSGGVKIEIALSHKYASCADGAIGDLATVSCVNSENDIWDGRLNAAYLKLRAELPKGKFDSLQKFQRLWIVDRDAACQGDPDDGTAGRLASDMCYLEATAVRAADLETRATAAGTPR
jgi:uncharacterized protein YecT (DUF1311 family)